MDGWFCSIFISEHLNAGIYILLSCARGKIPHKSTQLLSKISVYSDIFVQAGIRDSACLQYGSVLQCASPPSTYGSHANSIKWYFFMFSARVFLFFRFVYQLQPKEDKVWMRDWAECILRWEERKHLALGWDFTDQNRRRDNNSTESVTCDARVPAAVKNPSFFDFGFKGFSKVGGRLVSPDCSFVALQGRSQRAAAKKWWKQVKFTASRAAVEHVWIIISAWSVPLWEQAAWQPISRCPAEKCSVCMLKLSIG